ncbi:MAG: LamG domain-containing protein [Eubacteriales bacterium]|nr:LamG domain-containing protein [Eubacteriales bacterium]
MIVVTGDLHTKLLLHGDSFLDGSKDKRVITNTGVAVSTAQSKFGGSSFYFDGSAYLTAPGYDFSTDDFTIDWWEYPTNANAGTRFTNVYCTSYATQAGGILLYVNEDGLRLYLSNKTGGATTNDWNVLSYTALGSNVINTWTHRAVVRSGSRLMFFKNGLLEYTYNIGTNRIGYSADRPWGIGNWASDLMTTGYPYIGYIDEFRVSDIARWTESFTPPTEPYPDSNIEILPGVIPIQYALRRRMMSKKPAPQWTLTIENVASYTSVSINGEKLTAGSYVVDDGTIVSFVITGGMTQSIYLDGVSVGTTSYDLVMHANYTATSKYLGFIAKWEITTQP